MKSLVDLIMAPLMDGNNYEQRKLGRTEVNGIIVSTALTSDMGYETAILDQNGVHPVERYSSKEKAELGHEKWVNDSPAMTAVTKLGYDDLVDNEEIEISRAEEYQIPK